MFSESFNRFIFLTHPYGLVAEDACSWGDRRGVLGIDGLRGSIVYKYGRAKICPPVCG